MNEQLVVDKIVTLNLEELDDILTRYNTNEVPYFYSKEDLPYFWLPQAYFDMTLKRRARYVLALSQVHDVTQQGFDANCRPVSCYETGRVILGAICIEDITHNDNVIYSQLIGVSVNPKVRKQGIATKMTQFMLANNLIANNQLRRSSPGRQCPALFTNAFSQMLNKHGINWAQEVEGIVVTHGNPCHKMMAAFG